MKHSVKRKQNKGFTLAELLIVVAIIAVLVAISIPIFTSQLEKSREATDAANIRSQYAQVMIEAITSGGDVDGKTLYGAVELKQKKDEWQNTGLKSNLEGIYGQVVGYYPKAGGTAWVEYKADEDKVILHYEGGNNSGGTDSGKDFGGGSDPGGGSDSKDDASKTIEKIKSDAKEEIPAKPADNDYTTYNKQLYKGNVYTYQGETYILTTDTKLVNQWNWPVPGTEQANQYYIKLDNNRVLTNADSSNGRDLPVKRGDIFQSDDGTLYLFNAGGTNYVVPSVDKDGKWIKININ